MSLLNKIFEYRKSAKRYLFTTPSHAQGEFLIPLLEKMLGKKYFECDYSETDGFDNIRHPKGAIKALLQKISTIYTANSFILTNGSSSGIMAIMMSILKDNDEVLIARNCHESVYNGLVLTGARPVWFMPEYDTEWGIFKGINPEQIEKKLRANPFIRAVIITSPTYEGILSDIEAISEVTKKYNVALIVDEAHGALLNFYENEYRAAVLKGADASVQSLHKNAGALNPCALLHLSKKSVINFQKVQECLNTLNTTSPSYPSILGAEASVDFLFSQKGREELNNLISNIKSFKEKLEANSSFKIYSDYNDITKILIKADGISALKIADILNNKFNIEEEFSTQKSLLFLTGIGTTKKKLDILLKNLLSINLTEFEENSKEENQKTDFCLPQMIYSPREAFFKASRSVNKNEAIGKISHELVIAYPPGVPSIIPGELITEENIILIEGDTIDICSSD